MNKISNSLPNQIRNFQYLNHIQYCYDQHKETQSGTIGQAIKIIAQAIYYYSIRLQQLLKLDRNCCGQMIEEEPSLIRSLKGHKQSIIALDLYPSCKYVASAGMDNIIFLWNLAKKSAPLKLIGHKSQIHDIKFSPAGNIIVSASNDESLKFWDIGYEGSGKETTLIKAHNARIRGISFSCDGLLLASCGDDKLIKVWSTIDRRLQYTLKKHTNWVRHCEFSATASNLASCDDKFVYIWDVNTKKHIQSYSEHTGVIHKVKFHSLGNCLATCSHDTKIKLYDLRSQSVVQTYEGHKGPVKSIDFHPHSHYLISSSDDGTTKIWNTKKSQLEYDIESHSNNTRFSRHGDYFITGGSEKIIYIWKTGFYDSLNEKILAGPIQLQSVPKKGVVQNGKTGRINSNPTEQSIDIRGTDRQTSPKKNNYMQPETKSTKYGLTQTNLHKIKEDPQIYYNHAEQILELGEESQAGNLRSSKSMKQLRSEMSLSRTSMKQTVQNMLPQKLVRKLSKISHQLDFITRTTQILEARILNNGTQLRRLVQLNNEIRTSI